MKSKSVYKKLREQYTDEEIAESMILPSKKLSKKEEQEFSAFIKKKKMELTGENVSIVVKNCLFAGNEDTSTAVLAKGVQNEFGFNPERLAKNEETIIEFLKQLPENFRVDKGGGWSFLSAIDTIDGTQWAQHQNVDELMCLGLAIGRVKFLLPREMWNALPGGMPYFSIDVTPLKDMRKKKLDQLNERQEGNKI